MSNYNPNNPTTPAPTTTTTTRKPSRNKTAWKGQWDYKAGKYVGKGIYEGQDRPQDNAPSWWLATKAISGDRYLKAYSKATYSQDLDRTFWFADKNALKAAKEMVDEWCDNNEYERLKRLPARRASVSEAVEKNLSGKVLFKKK